MEAYKQWISEAEEFSQAYLSKDMPDYLHFHNAEHVAQVVGATYKLGGAAGLNLRDLSVLVISAWFHDLGYRDGGPGHEERSAQMAQTFLEERHANADYISEVRTTIMATKMPQQPISRLDTLMADADLSHLGTGDYWYFIGRLRQELKDVHHKVMTDQEWLEFEVDFLSKHKYHSPEAQVLFGRTKKKHIKKLQRMLAKFNTTSDQDTGKKPKKDAKKGRLSRGVETMFRSAYRTHISLSAIADNKANIMLSINAIILSITISALVPRFATQPALIWPSVLLLAVCMVAIVFATLSTMPKITTGQVSREAITQKKANLIFFGNTFNMSLEDYQWGMDTLINDDDFIYDTMSRDLFFLGKVLAKKYAYLRWCYLTFMWGLIATILAFILVLV